MAEADRAEKDTIILVNLSGRGDKDMASAVKLLKPEAAQ
jgi:tryptophan synthase beta subunit